MTPSANLLNFDALALIMVALVVFIGLTVAAFAARYLRGDSHYRRFFLLLGLLILSVVVMVAANHLLLLLGAWIASNLLLVALMVGKASWPAARAAGRLAARTLLGGGLCLAAACALLYASTGESAIQRVIATADDSGWRYAALVLLVMAALMQSGLWPFHRWLLSSLNSPTPVSALMHAGLINSGGFLLVRFAPLYGDAHLLLTALFLVGLVSALLGTLWQLMQPDIKRTLACSTLGQMGFMVAQCGLGLFPAAIAHLCWHGLFKAHLFLAAPSAAQERKSAPLAPPPIGTLLLALLCGAAGSYTFALLGAKGDWTLNSTLVLVAVAFLAASQFALGLLTDTALRRLPFAFAATALVGALYGLNVQLVTAFLAPLGLLQPQPLNGFHLAGVGLLALAWLGLLYRQRLRLPQSWQLRLYMKALNASQPHPATVTAYRNHYRYR